MDLKNNKIVQRLSRLWPTKKWKKIVFTLLLLFVVIGVPVIGYFEWSVFREVTTPLDVKNPEGSKTALVVYHPGLTSFAHDIAYSFAEGLIINNWRVEISTVSSQTPTQIENYDLLVLNWPIYDFNPGPTITNYIARVENLQNVQTVIITVGGGLDPFNCQSTMNSIVQDANGNVRESITAFRGGNATDSVREIADSILP